MPAGGEDKDDQKEIEAKQSVKIAMMYFITLPQEQAHSGHPTGLAGIYTQKIHAAISQKIVNIVEAGITDTTEIKHSLRYYVTNYLSKQIGRKPHAGDTCRSFYPLNKDTSNHVSKAKRPLDLPSMTRRTYI